MAIMKYFAPFSVTFLSTVTAIMAAAYYYPQLPPPQQFNQYGNPYPSYYQHPMHRYMSPGIQNNTYDIRGHDFALGAPNPREKILLHSTIYKRPGLWSNYATKEITFPPKGSHLRVTITRIYAKDRARNGTGAFVKLTGGGIGQGNATLLFRSQRYQPINFELDIFGYPK